MDNKIKEEDINLDHVNYLISLNLSDQTLAKRMYRAKKVAKSDGLKRSKYFELCLVKAHKVLL